MMGRLLLLGMLAGLIAGVLAFGVARVWGEPPVAAAIAIEEANAEAEHSHAAAPAADHAAGEIVAPAPEAAGHSHGDEELVSRATQAGLGLFVGMTVFATALGGIFALVFAWAQGRVSDLRPVATTAAIALLGFVAVVLIPALKYPANPPAVGHEDTIGLRTGMYFLMMAISAAAMVVAVLTARRAASGRVGILVGAAIYVAAVAVAMQVLPRINEVPADFPADVLRQFRVVSLVIEAVLWGVTGLLLGWLIERDGRALSPRMA
ncbi:MAG: CbtA family protein [Paracoccus sp. (in: a-proteobacteria)]|nr:CbtA family protein [Paracoccus sp. (in: a-proteobacteria)]